jgi:hypothetical protein
MLFEQSTKDKPNLTFPSVFITSLGFVVPVPSIFFVSPISPPPTHTVPMTFSKKWFFEVRLEEVDLLYLQILVQLFENKMLLNLGRSK